MFLFGADTRFKLAAFHDFSRETEVRKISHEYIYLTHFCPKASKPLKALQIFTTKQCCIKVYDWNWISIILTKI